MKLAAIIVGGIVAIALLAFGGFAISSMGGSGHSASPRINNNITNNNSAPAPAPTHTQYVPRYVQPAPAPAPPVSDVWTVAQAYTSDISNGDYSNAWNMLSPAMQQDWNSDYYTFVANFTPIGFDNTQFVSESGDAVTFTFDLNNTNTGTETPHTCTYTVDGGLITSSTG